MTVTGNTRQAQLNLATEAVLLAGKACVAGISATVTRCERKVTGTTTDKTRLPRKTDRGQQGFGFGWQWGMCTIGGTYLVGGRKGSMDRRRLAVDVEQRRRKKSSSSSSTRRGRSGRYAKRAGGRARADRDGDEDARCQRPGARPAGQGREWQTGKATYRTGKDMPYCGHVLGVGKDQARGFWRSAVTG
jgi:hypothetical protein